jgi:hypothetical protein
MTLCGTELPVISNRPRKRIQGLTDFRAEPSNYNYNLSIRTRSRHVHDFPPFEIGHQVLVLQPERR